MIITFRDNLGAVMIAVDEYGIQFLNSKAVFSSGDNEYSVPIENIISIMQEG